MFIIFSLLLVIAIPDLWMNYFSYPQVDADIVCKMNGGQWNENGNYCDGIFDICERVGGTKISWDVTPECESKITETGDSVCLDMGLIHISCTFQ
ncbi:hypothetical protein C5F50_06565 [Nitrosopumilus ureiphilus]|uniref:Uncharacterized protein n=2 Tax=Nitrosopumilus ureiphilus TaxID=1470067 RepID=A0A7D5R1Q0_9ARCH|nr:hypothetical protein C5F50_06565 [Nitrosopumilus ureiphilus]